MDTMHTQDVSSPATVQATEGQDAGDASALAGQGAADLVPRKKVGRPRKWTPERIEAEGEALLAWLQEDKERFWVKSFAHERGYTGAELSQWAKSGDYPEFSKSYRQALEIQERRILDVGLYKAKSQALPIMMLKANHGWRDVQEVQQTSVNVGVDITDMSPQEARNHVQQLLDDYDSVQPPALGAGDEGRGVGNETIGDTLDACGADNGDTLDDANRLSDKGLSIEGLADDSRPKPP